MDGDIVALKHDREDCRFQVVMDVLPSNDTRGKKDVVLNAKTNVANTHTDLAAFRELVLLEVRHALGCEEHRYRYFDVLAAGFTLSSPVQSKLAVGYTLLFEIYSLRCRHFYFVSAAYFYRVSSGYDELYLARLLWWCLTATAAGRQMALVNLA